MTKAKSTSPPVQNKASLSYKDAGVDIQAGNSLVDNIKNIAQATRRKEVMAGLGGFGALFELPGHYREPVLVSGTDGVGTKLKLAMALNQHDTIGIDLVAMCVNDLIVGGAEPLFFLDYYACGRLSVDVATQVVQGIGEGCQLSGCALVGGETAEMPGMYADEDYDLAGFCVGIVEKSKILDGSNVAPGDALIGLASSGPHSNGYSLIRKILQVNETNLLDEVADRTLAEALMAPTSIYVKPLLALLEQHTVHAMAHITGGGLTENIPRTLPKNVRAVVDCSKWAMPDIFQWLQRQGNVLPDEMLRTFNCGVGMVVCVPHEAVQASLKALREMGQHAFVMGHIEPIDETEVQIKFVDLG